MLKFISIFSIFVLLVVGAIYFVFHSHFLKVAAVEVSGSAKAEEIKGALINNLAETSKIRYLLGSDNLLFWSSKAIRQIPSSLNWLSDLNLKRNWQEKKIVIEVKEREPWLLWCLFANQSGSSTAEASSTTVQIVATSSNCYWLDGQGIVFASAPEAEGFIVLKVFEEGNRQQLSFGRPFYSNPQLVANTLEIIKQLENSSLMPRRFLIENINLQELKAETEGPKLYFSLRFLTKDLNKILTDLTDRLSSHGGSPAGREFQKLEYIDLRVENRIYYK